MYGRHVEFFYKDTCTYCKQSNNVFCTLLNYEIRWPDGRCVRTRGDLDRAVQIRVSVVQEGFPEGHPVTTLAPVQALEAGPEHAASGLHKLFEP